MNPKPALGRVVHFIYGGEHFAATITKVHPKTASLVDLVVFDLPNSAAASKISCIAHGNVEDNRHYTWHWPERE